ncbi:MAG TPA: tetratricopeptide repeat protein [Vicinamibacterales bacterium]
MVLQTLALAIVLLTGATGTQEGTGAAPLPHTSGLPGVAGRAINAAAEAVRRDPQSAAAAGHLAVLLHAWEQWEPAAEAYARARALAPADPQWWHLSGLLEVARGRHAEAVPLFLRAAELDPSRPEIRLRLAESLLEIGDTGKAAALFRPLAKEPATAAPAEYGLGRIAAARGDHAQAVAHFERAVERFPEFGAAHYALALSYRRLGKADAARDALARQQACLACWPAVDDPLAAKVRAAREDAASLVGRGIAAAEEGRTEEAIAAHERALEIDPGNTQARVNLIALYARARRWADAAQVYRQVVATGTHLADAHISYGEALLTQRRAAEARDVFRLAIEANPGSAPAHNGLGLALEMGGDTAGALGAYARATKEDPALRVARFNYGRALVAAGRLPEAIAELERLKTPQDAETPRYLYALSAALVRSGNVSRGLEEARAALALARKFGQEELAATIEANVAKIGGR